MQASPPEDRITSILLRQPASPPSLLDAQRRMAAWVGASPPTARAACEGEADAIVRGPVGASAETADAFVRGPVGASADIAVAVYAAGYPARIREALLETFEVVERIVGARAFTDLALRYAVACPPRSWNLNDAGDSMPAFLASDVLAETFPFLPDLAELELRIAQSFHAPVEDAADLAELSQWTAEEQAAAVLRFQPSLFVVSSRWPLAALWRSARSGSGAIDVDLSSGGHAIVWRQDLDVMLGDLDDTEAAALAGLRAGSRLGVTMDALCARGVAADQVARFFRRCAQLGLITSFTNH
ncbi:MAG TPA: DNA-binding domain-containing protein [Candidatus Binatia bacterium]|nr:DNA-binding domain-containing protein [Candidatus Binatia bacterium]